MGNARSDSSPHRLVTVLTHTDLTPASSHVLECAGRVARDEGAELHVIHATGLVGAPLGEALPRLLGGYTDGLRADLDAQVRKCLPAPVVPHRCTLRHELPWKALEAAAAEVEPDLIVADPDAMKVRARAVADLDPPEVVRRSGAPLLIPARTLRWPFRRAVLLTKPEPIAEAHVASALSWLGGAGPEGRDRSSHLRVVAVADDVDGRREVAAADAEEVIIVPVGAGAPTDRTSFRAAVETAQRGCRALLVLPIPRAEAESAGSAPTPPSPLAPREEAAATAGAP